MFVCHTKWIKHKNLGWRLKGLHVFGVAQWYLFHSMDIDVIWSILQTYGFNERKLALSNHADAELIAEQVCGHVGCICERDHVESVRMLIHSCQLKEPVRKRLREDHHLDPLLIDDRISGSSSSVVVQSTAMSSAAATGSKHSSRPLGIRHRQILDQSNAHEKRDQAQRDKWARELYM